MGRSEKLYITASEWAAGPGCTNLSLTQLRGARSATPAATFRQLPFYCCALTLQPFITPVCTASGAVYELTAIVPWLKAHANKDPVSGKTIDPDKDLFPLTFARSPDSDDFICPITFKTFTDSSHIVSIRTSGNVYAYEAVDQLNIKTKSWTDLVSGEPFTKKDIITIQDPTNAVAAARNISEFEYIKKGISPPPIPSKSANEASSDASGSASKNINAVGTTSRILSELASKSKPVSSTPSFVDSSKKRAYNAASFSKGLASASFTSSAVDRVLANDSAIIDDHEYAIQHVTSKSTKAIIHTNFGNIHLKLFINHAPRTCYNFVKLARKGYYKDTIFHRMIPNFMVQGGDPTGKGTSGESIWGTPFPDEFRSGLSHDDRGILSMANKGKDTNTSQFFITFAPKPHLDNKHTIFGKVVDGMDVLDLIESIKTNDSDRPKSDIKILDIEVARDPFEEALEKVVGKDEREAEQAAKRLAERERRERLVAATKTVALPTDNVGKYLDKALEKRKREGDLSAGAQKSRTIAASMGMFAATESSNKKTKRPTGGFGNFDGW